MSPLYQKLQQLIGQQFDYLSDRWELVEVLDDRDSVVLLRIKNGRSMPQLHADQYGHVAGHTQETLTVKISDASGEGFSEDLITLLEGRIS